jgi:hypothetical protein
MSGYELLDITYERSGLARTCKRKAWGRRDEKEVCLSSHHHLVFTKTDHLFAEKNNLFALSFRRRYLVAKLVLMSLALLFRPTLSTSMSISLAVALHLLVSEI